MRVVFMGTPGFGVFPLEHLLLSQHEVVAVYTPPDKPAGRGRNLAASPVKVAAEKMGLPVVQSGSLKSDEAFAGLAAFSPEVIVVAAYGQLLPRAVLELPRYGCINIHPSLLPHYRGAAPVAGAILAGDEFAGVSIMLLDRGMDTGPVFTRAQIGISDRDTTGTLTAKLSLVGARLLQEVLVYWPRGELSPRPQDEAEATYTSPIAKEDGRIDWHLSAADIWRRVRAFQTWPGCYTYWQGKQLKIMEAVPVPGGGETEVGRVVELEAEFGVITGSGILGVMTVQPEGKRPMSADQFLRGQRQMIGEILG